LLITADSGGSNGSRLRLWKTQLAELATETGLRITVCHLPRACQEVGSGTEEVVDPGVSRSGDGAWPVILALVSS
jgi:hypothetical protein